MISEKQVSINGTEFTLKRRATSALAPEYKITGSTITILLPVSLPREEAFRTFMEMQKEAIAHISKNPEMHSKRKELEFHDGQKVEVLGRSFEVCAIQGNATSSSAGLHGATVEVKLAKTLTEEQKKRHTSNLARRAISSAVMEEVRRKVEELNARHFNEQFKKVFLKDNLSNWGSCSHNRNINLNFRLLFAPQSVLEYVIIHELAHLKQQNHSSEFWALVEGAIPGYENARKWLLENGEKLGIMENDG